LEIGLFTAEESEMMKESALTSFMTHVAAN